MKVSIVTAYHNRRELLINTLNSILLENYNCDLEIIIIDDNSNEENKITDIKELYPTLDIKILEITKEEKWWVNPCIPFNKGFDMATGEVVIIQNPECLHIGNIIQHTADNIKDNKYIVYSCYSSRESDMEKMKVVEFDNNYIENIKNGVDILMKSAVSSVSGGWYQHSKYRNNLLHFCTAITKKDLDELGGFDERFAKGIGKDDREFVLRIQRKKMNIVNCDAPYVIHQRHKPFSYSNTEHLNNNGILYNQISREKRIKVNE